MPLGTPQRMSPVTTPTDETPSKSNATNATADASTPAPLPSLDAAPAKNEENGPDPSSEKPKKEKKPKDKKAKSKSKESTGDVKVNRVYILSRGFTECVRSSTGKRIMCSGAGVRSSAVS